MDDSDNALNYSKELRRAIVAEEKAAGLQRQLYDLDRLRNDFEQLKNYHLTQVRVNEELQKEINEKEKHLQEQDQRIDNLEMTLQKAEWWGRGVIYMGGASLLLASQLQNAIKWIKSL